MYPKKSRPISRHIAATKGSIMLVKPVSIHRLAELDEQSRSRLMFRAESAIDAVIEKVRPIIEDVRQRGDEALIHYAHVFDKADLAATGLRVAADEFAQAERSVDGSVISALTIAADNIRRFHHLQMPDSLVLHETQSGVLVGDRWTAIESVACYVPRGKGSFPSSVLMTTIPAKIAGVNRIVITTPPGSDGRVDAATLVAAKMAGIDEVYKCGGAQAIAAIAYGTESIPSCRKVVGPGSAWVAAAKKGSEQEPFPQTR